MKIKYFIMALLLSLSFISLNSLALPQGSYQSTCRHCVLLDGTLSCQCQVNPDAWWPNKVSFLRVRPSCYRIYNDRGTLRCMGKPLPRYLPWGNYKDTCRYCRFSQNYLTCQCQMRDGVWRPTSLWVRPRCTPIRNQNGHLVCHHQRWWPLPAGSYKETCQLCHFNGRVLRCNCQRANGSWRPSRLRVGPYCNWIANQNGRLIC